jgi:hypothetical protein
MLNKNEGGKEEGIVVSHLHIFTYPASFLLVALFSPSRLSKQLPPVHKRGAHDAASRDFPRDFISS